MVRSYPRILKLIFREKHRIFFLLLRRILEFSERIQLDDEHRQGDRAVFRIPTGFGTLRSFSNIYLGPANEHSISVLG